MWQHPRDLFDVKLLLENEGITTDVKDSFLFYLISHARPINELLNPNFKDLSKEYKNEFLDMAKIHVALDELIIAREKLVLAIKQSLTEDDKRFLVSFVENNPDWSLVRDSKIKHYPSVLWKLHNQKQMSDEKKIAYVEKMKLLLSEPTKN